MNFHCLKDLFPDKKTDLPMKKRPAHLTKLVSVLEEMEAQARAD
jgi:hypothetical protein